MKQANNNTRQIADKKHNQRIARGKKIAAANLALILALKGIETL